MVRGPGTWEGMPNAARAARRDNVHTLKPTLTNPAERFTCDDATEDQQPNAARRWRRESADFSAHAQRTPALSSPRRADHDQQGLARRLPRQSCRLQSRGSRFLEAAMTKCQVFHRVADLARVAALWMARRLGRSVCHARTPSARASSSAAGPLRTGKM